MTHYGIVHNRVWEQEFREDPLDTSVRVPWWVHDECHCNPDALHLFACRNSPIYCQCVWPFVDVYDWPLDYFFSQHLWMWCPDCERKFGEINGSRTAHFCEAIRQVVQT